MSWLVWYEPKALIMGKKDTKKNNMFRNCNKFSPGARGVFHMEAPGSVQEPGDEFFYCWFSPGARGWICYWRSRISPGVSSCWSSCTPLPPHHSLFHQLCPLQGIPTTIFHPGRVRGRGETNMFFAWEGVRGMPWVSSPRKGGQSKVLKPPLWFWVFLKKNLHLGPGSMGENVGFCFRRG